MSKISGLLIGVLITVLLSFSNNLWAQTLICNLERPTVNVKDFYDKNKDDTTALLKAFQCAESILNKSGRVIIRIPSGIYKLSSPILIKQPANSDWKAIKIEGEGIEQSVILLEKGGFYIELWNREPIIEIGDLSFVATAAGAGKALYIYMPPGGNRHNRSLIVKNLLIKGTSAQSDTWFETGIETIGVWRPYIHNVFMTGPFGPLNKEVIPNSNCFVLKEVYSPQISNSACWSANVGLQIIADSNPAPEGLQIISSKFVNVNVGIEIDNKKSIEPEGVISNNHINARKYGLIIKGKKFVFINNNLFYVENSSEFVHIFIDRSEKIYIYNNIFHYPDRRIPKESSKTIEIEQNVSNTSICGNYFNSPGIGVYIHKGANDIKMSCENEFFIINNITKIPLNRIKILDENAKSKEIR